MERKERHVQGRSIVLERQERVSIEGRQRIYIKNNPAQVRELYRHPSVGVPGSASERPKLQRSSSSLGLEKIQRTRQQVNSLYRKIEHEIERLKHFRNYFLKSKETSSKSGSPEMASARGMTWGQSFEANQARVSPLGANRSPVSGSKDVFSGSRKPESKGPKCRTIAVKSSPAIDPPELSRRASGGCCYCCGNCEQNHRTTYQNSYGNGTSHCNCSCNCNMGQQQHFSGCSGFYGQTSPNQGMQFGIPYCICPRQTCQRTVTDLNTQETCRHLCSNLLPDRALSPKNQGKQRESLSRTKSREEKSPDRCKKSTTNKKLEMKIRAGGTTIDSASLDQHKVQSHKKLLNVNLKKEQKTSEDRRQGKPKAKTENVLVSDFVSLKDASGAAAPSKMCSDEKTDDTKDRMYQDYFNLYDQENSKSELGGWSGVEANPTYTRMLLKEEIKTEVDQQPVKKQCEDQIGAMNSSQEDTKVQGSIEDICCCDVDQNKMEDHSSTDEQLISIKNLCCCEEFNEESTRQNEQESVTDNKMGDHHQLTDEVLPTSSPKTEDCHYYEEKNPGPAIEDGGYEDRSYRSRKDVGTNYGYSKPKEADNRYLNDSRSVAPWNYTNPVKSDDNRYLHKTRSASKASRIMYPQQFKSLRNKDKDCKVVKQRSESPQCIQSTSYASYAPRIRGSPPERHVQREARNTQTDIPCREERRTQTEAQARCEKSLQVCLEQQHHPKQIDLAPDPPLPTPSRAKYTPLHHASESFETIAQNQYYDNRSRHSDKPYNEEHNDTYNLQSRSHNSKDESAMNYPDRMQRSPRTQNELRKDANYRLGYGNAYEISERGALACRQEHLNEHSYRTPIKTQKAQKDSPRPFYKQSNPRELQNSELRQYSPRTPKESYNPVSQRALKMNECYDYISPPAVADFRSTSPNRNHSLNYKSSSSCSIEDPNESDRNQCSEWQEAYESQRKIQSMRRNAEFFRDPNTEYTSFPDQIQTRWVETPIEYEEQRLDSPRKVCDQLSPRSCMSSSPRRHPRIEEGEVPVLETICDKRTRTVTFEDECGDLTKEELVQETCHSLIDWKRALKYHMVEQGNETDNTDENYTCRSSSSAEHTCNESNYNDDYASCEEQLPKNDYMRVPPFDACPCMYKTYTNLAAMCQK
ncbi:uncharacterized protein LOC108045950 isoform X2 [Drosophila rhopaloa]|uniref:Uncharacterized protein n=1 Tax=Drosophila rhopaloa TaxID=1041015 RepID=A0ABM5JF90_DRORH|nr:uncharacterized protein LOC108045950 isoform X2 [Drosophila rhopaloa]